MYCLSKRARLCFLQVSGNTLQQVEKFKYLRVVLPSDGSQNQKGFDTRSGKAKIAKLSVFKSVFVPILTCGHES